MKFLQSVILLIVVLLTEACIDYAGENETLTPLPFTVTARGTAFYGKDGIHAPGPVNQLCVGIDDRATINRGLSPPRARIEVPWRKPGELAALLIDSDSARIPLQFAGTRKTDHGQVACFETELSRNTARNYSRGELVADDTVDVYGIQWASGKNVISLSAPADSR